MKRTMSILVEVVITAAEEVIVPVQTDMDLKRLKVVLHERVEQLKLQLQNTIEEMITGIEKVIRSSSTE